MKNRLKRTVAWLLAVLMVLGSITVGDVGVIQAQASQVTDPGQEPEPQNITVTFDASGLQTALNTAYGVAAGDIVVSYSIEGSGINGEATIGAGLTFADVTITAGTTGTLNWKITSVGNYSFKDGKEIQGSVTIDALSTTYSVTLNSGVTTITDDLGADVTVGITGDDTATIDDEKTFTAEVSPEVWASDLTYQWSIDPSSSAVQIQGADNQSSVMVKALADGSATLKLTVQKNGQEIGTAVKTLKISKKSRTVTLTYNPQDSGQSWQTELTLTATVDGFDQGESVTFYQGSTPIGTEAIQGTGTATTTWTPTGAGPFTLTASVAESTNYSAATSSGVTYSPAKAEQDFVAELISGVEVTYGDSEIAVAKITDEGTGVSNPTFSVAFTEDSQVKGQISYDPASKQVTFIPDRAGTASFVITKNGNANYNDKQSDPMTITVKKKVVTIKSDSVKASDRAYDGTQAVAIKAELEGLVGTDNSSSEITATGTIQSADAGENKDVAVTFDLETITGFADKYTFKAGEDRNTMDTTTSVTIDQVALTFTISDANVEWQKKDSINDYVFTEKQITVSGFVNNETAESLNGFEYPKLTLDMAQFTDGDAVGTTIANAIIADRSEGNCGNPTGNYYFDFENYVKKGSVTLTAQTVQNYSEFLKVDNAASQKVYEKVDENGSSKIYYGVSAGDVTVTFIPDAPYDQVWYNNQASVDNTIEIDSSLPITTLEMTLKSADGTKETAPFSVTLYRDNVNPLAELEIASSTKTWSNFTEAVTFGVFGTELEASISVSDAGEGEYGPSGIKNWSYTVVNTDKDVQFQTKPATEDDVKALFENCTFTAVSDPSMTSVTVPLGKADKDSVQEDGNYIVFVLVTDNVGNSALYGSNGAIVDNIMLDSINISYKTAAQNKPDYFSGPVDLEIIVTENTESIYTGVGKVAYAVTPESGITCEAKTNNEKTDGVFMDLFTDGLPDDTLTNLENKYGIYKDGLNLSIGENVSSRIKVEITSYDFAGNPMTESKEFVIDNKAPEIVNQLTSAASVANGKYYSDNVVITTTITERYLDMDNDVIYYINGKDYTLGELRANPAAFGLKSVQVSSEALDETTATDKSKTVITLAFDKEAEYTVSAEVKDKAGNTAKTADTYTFVVDKTDPVVHITYYSYGSGSVFSADGSTAQNPVYLNMDYSSFKAVITVEEKNFVEGDSVAAQFGVTAKDSSGKVILSDFTDSQKQNAAAAASWNSNGIVRTYGDQDQCFIREDANYSFSFNYTDLSGRKAQVTTDYITLDTMVPDGSITVTGLVNHASASQTWSSFINKITFGFFGKDPMNTTLDYSDATAGVASVQYLVTSELLSREQLGTRTDWKNYTSPLTLTANNNIIIYEKIVDKAGNTVYYSTENIVADNVDPAPTVTLTPTSPAWGKGVYAAADHPGFDISVTDPAVGGAYSGLKEITYRIVNGTTGETESGTLATFDKSAHTQTWNGHVSIDPNRFYSNDVQVTVTATDWSTNEAASETKTLKIDNKAPVVTFSFDTSDALNGKYYKNTKTLTITVDERNFDTSYTPTVTSTAGGGYSFGGWSSNGEIHTGVVTFSGDSDYTVTFDCYDLAGNKSNTENLTEFTVDKTLPTVSVTYNNNAAQNGKYYKEARTATITITEHNFRASEVRVTTTASLNGASIAAPTVSGWSSSGDRHTATITYGKDGDFTFDIAYSDLAGNAMADYAQDSFTVDLTNPEIEITGVANKSANKGAVAPVITLSDTNYTADGVTLTLTGANKGKISVDSMVTRTTNGSGQTITFRNFGSGMDDIYTLTAKSVDRAGNETSKSITFSVNRDGSTYIIDEATQKLIDTGFTNSPRDIVISEINVDTLEFIEITYSKDGQVVTLKEGADYTVKAEGGEGQWKKYTYTIKASCFEDEGEYSINIYSEDRAANTMTNRVKGKSIEFIVDKTAPTVSIANLENRGRYRASSHDFTLSVKDNTVLSYVELYLDGELVHTYTADELQIVDGQLTITVDSKNDYQNVKIIAYDAAGNPTDPVEYNVLVTSNWFIQFFANKPLFFGSIAALAVVIGLIIFLIAKRRKKEK